MATTDAEEFEISYGIAITLKTSSNDLNVTGDPSVEGQVRETGRRGNAEEDEQQNKPGREHRAHLRNRS